MSRAVQPYPLYDYLAKKAEANRDKIIDLSLLCATINNMCYDEGCPDYLDHYREIGVLIFHHDLINNKGVMLSHVPYEGKTISGGKGIMFNSANLQPKLQHILAHYIEDPVGALRACTSEN